MLISLVLWACASKSVPADVESPELDAKAGTTMVPEVAEVAPAKAVRMPGDQVVVRECFGGSRGGRGRTASVPPPPPAPRPNATSSAPTTPMATPTGTAQNQAGPTGGTLAAGTGSSSSLGGAGTKGAGKSGGYPAPAESTPEPTVAKAKAPTKSAPKADAPAAQAELADNGDDSDDFLAKKEAKRSSRRDVAKDEGGGALGWADEEEDAKPADKATERSREKAGFDMGSGPGRAERRDPNFDWGGITYLSNDDSMSLASAQRLLWAVQARGPVKTSEIRPHELLNYFSFDTTPVKPGDTFSVSAAAETTDSDTLSMAFAVKGVTPERKPLDLTMVLDRSGSMEAEGRMEYLKRGLTKMTAQLQRGDRLDLVLFDDELCTPLENFVVGRDDPALLSDVIDDLKPRGSTDLNLGLREGYRIAKGHADVQGRNRRMLLISDALLNTGEVDTAVVSEIGKSYESAGIRLTAVGVGRDFNDKVLDQLSEKGKGAYVYLGSEAVVDRIFGAGFDSLVQTVAHDVHFSLDLPDSLAIEKFYGEESSTRKEDVQPINYYAGTTQLFVQDLKMSGSRPVRSDLVKLTAEWTDVDTGQARTQVFTASVGDLLDADPRNLHKGRALLAWTDMIMARSLGNDPCGQPYATFAERVDELGADAELAWLDGLTSPLCGARPTVPKTVAVKGVPYKVKVDADQVIAEVAMQCGSKAFSEELSRGSNVATFEVRPGSCQLVLQGTVPMVASVEVPKTGGDVRCVVRGGRLSCG